jgi:glycerate dehydrogenase
MAPMKIVVLDGYTLNPGDLSWDALAELGECVIHDRTPPELVVDRARDADIVLTNKALLPREAILTLPKLRYIGVLATGYNVVDVAAAKSREIIVTNVPDYSTPSVAQHTFALLLELTQRAGHHSETVRDGKWTRNVEWCYWDSPLVELSGLRMGIVGFGRIGRAVAKLADAFGMHVIVATRTRPEDFPRHHVLADVDALFEWSDVVTLHCPLTPETKHLVNAERLGRMKQTAYVLNTGRGPLVDEAALAEALNAGKIAGAAVDVLSTEPPREDNPLLRAKNCIITPHIGWATQAARGRLMDIAVENVRAFLGGAPRNIVKG